MKNSLSKLWTDARIRHLLGGITILCLVANLLAVAPRPLAIGLVGSFFGALWYFSSARTKPLSEVRESIWERSLLSVGSLCGGVTWILGVWLFTTFAAHFRSIHMGFDLAFLTQPVTLNQGGFWLRSTIERDMNFLIQHWEPIWFLATPLSYLMSGRAAIVFFQGMALAIGAWGAWKVSHHLLEDKIWARLAWFLFLFSWTIVNPFVSEAHAPVFGSVALFPWIFLAILRKQTFFAVFLLLMLLQCGEIFFAIVPAYFVFLLNQHKKMTPLRWILGAGIYASGYLLLASYQRYFGAWFSGDADPSSFLSRYASLGGDSHAMLKTLFVEPWKFLLPFLTFQKAKTYFLALFTFGIFPFLAVQDKKNRALVFCVCLGLFPYFLKTGLSDNDFMVHTGRHYIAEFGPQWWLLAVLGIKSYCEKVHQGRQQGTGWNEKSIAFVVTLCVWNSSVWRQSPFLNARLPFVSEVFPTAEAVEWLSKDPLQKGIVFLDADWLCPIGAEHRRWLLCSSLPLPVLLKAPIDFLVLGENHRENLLRSWSPQLDALQDGHILKILHFQSSVDGLLLPGWKKVYEGTQTVPFKGNQKKSFQIWEKIKVENIN